MSVVRRERPKDARAKKRPLSPPLGKSPCAKKISPPVKVGPSLPIDGPVASSTPRVISQPHSQRAEPRWISAQAALKPCLDVPADACVTFVFDAGAQRIKARIADLLAGASAGWLAATLPEANGDEICVPEDTPLVTREHVQGFRILLKSSLEPSNCVPLSKAFAGKLRLLPHAFLAAHLLGMERAAADVRRFFLQASSVVLRSLQLRKGDGAALLRAFDLGLVARTIAPLRPGEAEKLEAVDLALRLALCCNTAGPAAATSAGTNSRTQADGVAAIAAELGLVLRGDELERISRISLTFLFRAAHDLRCKDLQHFVSRLVAAPGALRDVIRKISKSRTTVAGAAGSDNGSSDYSDPAVEALAFGVRNGIDHYCDRLVLHEAAALGLIDIVQLAVTAGQSVNAMSKIEAETPAMVAAAEGHVEVLRWLLQHKAKISMRSRSGLTVHAFAAARRQEAVMKLLLARAL